MVPVATRALARLVEHTRDCLDELGEYRWVRTMLDRQRELGNGARWQRDALECYLDPRKLVTEAARRTLKDTANPAAEHAARQLRGDVDQGCEQT